MYNLKNLFTNKTKLKYTMTNQELAKYYQEQRNWGQGNEEDYRIQYLMDCKVLE